MFYYEIYKKNILDTILQTFPRKLNAQHDIDLRGTIQLYFSIIKKNPTNYNVQNMLVYNINLLY